MEQLFESWRKYNNRLLEQECRITNSQNLVTRDESAKCQIKPEQVQDFILYLREQGIEAFKTRDRIDHLQASQESVDCEKVKAIARQGYEKLAHGPPIFVSQDHIIADGHHRVMALKLIDPNADIAMWEVQTEVGQLLHLMERFNEVYEKEKANMDMEL